MHDPRFAFRRLLKNPGLTAIAVLILSNPALGQSGAGIGQQRKIQETNSFAGAKAGSAIAVGGVKLCWCPAGRFQMGSPPGEAGRRDDEAQVELTSSNGFGFRIVVVQVKEG
jgi:hypothetical protein